MSDAPTDEELAEADDRANGILYEMMDDLEDEVDGGLVIYSLWVSLTRHLAEMGWTPDELAKDAAHHAAHQGTEGSA